MSVLDIGILETEVSPIGFSKTLGKNRAAGHLRILCKEPNRISISAQTSKAEERCMTGKCRDQSHDGSPG